MRHILFLLFMAFTLQAIAQYPATGNKMRLGWQTTGDGLVYRGAIGDTATLDPSGLNNAWMLLDTANGNLYAYRIKAWRLVSGGGGGGVTMPFDSVTFNVNETDASERELQYSEEKGYLQYGGLDSVQIPLLPGIWYVRNDTSVTIPKGTVVRATGTLGASGRIKVKYMIANGSIDAMYVLGIAMQDIAVGADGYVMTQGKIRQVNTQAYSEGAVLYADVDTLGGLTQTEPIGSNLKLPIAFVVHSASNGTLAVRVSPGTYLRDLHDAYITSPESNASLYYNTSESVWRDTTAAALKSDISGTTNYLAKFTGANTIGNSAIYEINKKILVNSTSSITTFNLPTIELHGNGSDPTTDQPIIAVSANNGNSAISRGYLNLNRSGGTTAGNTTLVPYNYFIGTLRWVATDGIEPRSGAEISAITDSITGLSDMPTALTFATTANGAASTTERMRITSAGNVGINTTTPAYRLDVNGDVNTTGMYKKSGTDIISGTTNYIPKFTGANTIGNSVLFDNGTNVGLGNTSPISGNGGGLTIGSPSAGRGLHLYTSGSGLFMYPTGSSNPSLQMSSSDADSSILYYTYFNYSHKFFTTNIERFRISHTGNVGIATSSPSRPLHVNANSSMIIPSGATGTRPALGADGDIRFNSTVGIKNLEWYNGAAWREPVNAARSPAAALANRFSKFDANGLLDTSAILIQANNRIGIFNSPAAGDSALTVTGGIRATRDMYARRYNVNTFGNEILSINNYAPANMINGRNVWIGDGGQASQHTGGQTGGYNVSLGAEALKSNTTGFGNIAVASQALSSNTTGVANVAVGGAALSQNLTTSYNTAVGANALQNSKSDANTAIGASALNAYNQSTGESGGNVGIGASSLSAKTTGDFDIAIGYQAGAFISTTGGTPLTNSNKNIFIGTRTYPNGNGQTGQIVIGHGAVGNGSNTTTIGNSSTTNTVIPAGSLTVDVMRRKAPVTVTGNHTVAASTSWLICDGTGAITLTLPAASSWTGREIMVKTIQPQAVNSASSNVVPIDGTATGTAILPATDGAWCTLVSDGTNWIIMQRGN